MHRGLGTLGNASQIEVGGLWLALPIAKMLRRKKKERRENYFSRKIADSWKDPHVLDREKTTTRPVAVPMVTLQDA